MNAQDKLNKTESTERTKDNDNQATEETSSFCTFWVGEALHGVRIQDVLEINKETQITPIFHVPEEILGYVNLRGQVYLILDLGLILGQKKKKEISPENRLVIFKSEVGESFGVLVDRIDDILEVPMDRFESAQGFTPAGQNEETRFLLQGVCKLEEKLLVVLNSRSIFRYMEQKNAA
ncbi:chemotaxis protein CheW [Candidatus Riflebacteria bacterium]